MNEIKTINEFIKEKLVISDDIKLTTQSGGTTLSEMFREYCNNLIDYIADNIDADYESHDMGDNYKEVEVYVPKEQFNEFKKMIK